MESLNRHFAALTKTAFQAHGFASEQLIAQWSAIMGPGIASLASPERIKWPKAKLHQGGTLYLRAPAHLALDLHYETPRIIERVNQFLGYGAIGHVKVITEVAHKPPAPKQRPRLTEKQIDTAKAQIPDIADQELHAALARLGSTISFSTGKTKPLNRP